MAYVCSWESSGIFWKYRDLVTGEEILQANRLIYGDPRFDELKYKLVDFTEVEQAEVSDMEITLIAACHRASAISNPTIRNALLIDPSSQRVTQLAETFARQLADCPWEIRIYHDINKANAWLGR